MKMQCMKAGKNTESVACFAGLFTKNVNTVIFRGAEIWAQKAPGKEEIEKGLEEEPYGLLVASVCRLCDLTLGLGV